MEHFERYTQILLWPLEVLEGDFKRQAARLEEVNTETGGLWTRLEYLDRKTTADANVRYAEYVYFHRFAQRFLYSDDPWKEGRGGGKQGSTEGPFIVWRRQDIGGVLIRPAGGSAEERLSVNRVHFYLFETQVAILVVEVEADRKISRSAAFGIQNEFRRAYAPFFTDQGRGGLTPEYVVWLDQSGRKFDGGASRSGVSNYHAENDLSAWGEAEKARVAHADNKELLKAEIERVYRTKPQTERLIGSRPETKEAVGFGGIPVASHWAWVLPRGLRYDYIEDDRIPQMHHFQVLDPLSVTRGDLIRMCFADGVTDDENDLPYGREFLSRFEENHCYDRFWSKDQALMTTRYMCCGYGFTVLTDASSFAISVLGTHFSHHYFQLGLLAHYHRASLLRFSRRLSDAETNDERRIVRTEFAEFTNSHWFREVSNQDQGRELFALWSRQLGNQELFEQVHTESRAVEDIVGSAQMLRLTNSVDGLTRRLGWLTLLTLVVAVMSWLVAYVEMTANKDWLLRHGFQEWHGSIGLLGVGVVLILAAGVWGFYKLRLKDRPD